MRAGQDRTRVSRSSSSATRRSCGVVTLKFSGEDSTIRTVPPARSTSHASSVARARIAVVDRQGRLQRLAAEGLRRLDRPQLRAVERRGDRADASACLTVSPRGRRRSRSPRARARPAPARTPRRDQRTGRVVDHDMAGPDGAPAPRARTPSASPRRARRCTPRAPSRPGQRDHDLVDPSRAQRIQRPLEHRPTGDLDERLRYRGAEPRAAARGHQQCYGPRRTHGCVGAGMRLVGRRARAASCSAVRRRISSR